MHIWNSEVEQRRNMLLDALRLAVRKKSRSEVMALLGKPCVTGNDFGNQADYYDLGEYLGEKIFLQAIYAPGFSPLFAIGQYAEDGYLQLITGEWRWENPKLKNAAHDLNKFYYIVGTPRKHLCQFVGHPQKEGRTWRCGSIELEFTSDNSRVKRFRLSPDRAGYFKVLTDWEDKDLRTVAGSYSTAIDFVTLSQQIDSSLIKPSRKFDPVASKQDSNSADMLFDLIHSKPLIGKGRAEIRQILGEPYYSEEKPSSGKRKEYFRQRMAHKEPLNRFDWFDVVRATGCCIPAEPSAFLEVVYRHDPLQGDIAAGYRMISSDKSRDGATEIVGNAFSRDVGFCLPVKTMPRSVK